MVYVRFKNQHEDDDGGGPRPKERGEKESVKSLPLMFKHLF